MWFLQRKSTHKRLLIWLKLAGFVSCVHIIFLLVLFFIYKDGVSNLTFFITSGVMRRDIAFTIAIETIPKKTQIMTQPKKTAATISPVTAVPVNKKDELQSVVQKEKPIEVKQVPKKKSPTSQSAKKTEHFDMQVGANKAMRGFEQECATLYQEIAACWMPPSGVPADSACKITMFIDRQGELADMNVDASSGVLVFDLAARSAVSELKFPRFAWGKSITITFTV
jgi:hypothetical protein